MEVIGFDYYGQIGNVPYIECFTERFTGLRVPGFTHRIDFAVFNDNENKPHVDITYINEDGIPVGGHHIPFRRQVGEAYGNPNGSHVRIGGASMYMMEILFCHGDKMLFCINCVAED